MLRVRPFPINVGRLIVSSRFSLGKPVSHAFAKELLAGFAGAEVDRLAETKGEDFVDREKAKHEARKQAESMYDDHYGNYDQYDPNSQSPPDQLQVRYIVISNHSFN